VIHVKTETVITDIEPQGRELSESELAAVLGGVAPAGDQPVLGGPTGGSCGGCH
jgi:hypothetical protein